MVWTFIILAAILLYAGLVIYRKVKRMKAGDFCCGSCEGCSGCSCQKRKAGD